MTRTLKKYPPRAYARILTSSFMLLAALWLLAFGNPAVAQTFTNCPSGSTCGVKFEGSSSAQAAWEGRTSGPPGTRGYSEGGTKDNSSLKYIVNIVGAPPGVPCSLDCTGNGIRILGNSEASAGGTSIVTSGTPLSQPLPAGMAAHNIVGAQSASNVALQQQFSFRFTVTPNQPAVAVTTSATRP